MGHHVAFPRSSEAIAAAYSRHRQESRSNQRALLKSSEFGDAIIANM
jgi:hypothetical protein